MNGNSTLFALILCCLVHAGLAGAQAPSVGLASVRARMFDNEHLVSFLPEPFDNFGSAVATGDFNGDGVEDLATGIPYDDGVAGSGCTNCGAVVVRYGVAGLGLDTALADDFLSLQYGESQEWAQPQDRFGSALAVGDFNGDGSDDLAVGVPGKNSLKWSVGTEPGAVSIHYGGFGGIQIVGEHLLRPGLGGVPLPPYSSLDGTVQNRFGSALAAGDFDANGFDDLAVGAPDFHFDIGPNQGTVGVVLLIGGEIGGLEPFNGFYMFEGEKGLPGTPEPGERFGQSVAAADFNGDGFDDLAIGVPGEAAFDGAALIVFGSPNSLIFANHRFWQEVDLGGNSEPYDRFAYTLAVGDFDGDTRDDLAIGTPFEDVSTDFGDMVDAGAVTVLYGHDVGFDLGRTQYFDQGVLGLSSYTSDTFGWALAAGDFDDDGRDDLAVGHHGENWSSFDSGAVTVIMGAPSPGLQVGRRRQIVQGSFGFPGGPPQDYRFFGYALAAGDFDDNGHSDLAIGAPGEDVGGLVDVGAEMVLYGSLFADGFDGNYLDFWSITVP